MTFWKRHLIEDRVECRVHAPSVKIGYINHNSLWVNILSKMGLWKTIPGGSAMVKPIVCDILWLVCAREVPLPSMQGSYEVHLVGEGWQVFFVRQAPTIPPY